MSFSPEEKAYLWMDSFFGMDFTKYSFLEAASSPLIFAENLEKFSSVLIKAGKECLYNNMKESLRSNAYLKELLSDLAKKGITPIPYPSKDYPEELKELKNPPFVLYAKGDISLLQEQKFTVVGSRKTQPSVLKLGEKMSETLAKHFAIVSGIADGGDRAALTGGMKGGKVICVLPCGHGAVPHTAASFYRELTKDHLAISECPYSFFPQKFSYFLRNRILAALGKGVLALSAGEKSGVLNTAAQALDLGRDVFALPYAPGIESGKGCNALIKSGAFLADSEKDILLSYGLEEKEEETSLKQNEILSLLKENGEMHLFELSQKTKRSMEELQEELLLLEMDGKIVKTAGNKYTAVG